MCIRDRYVVISSTILIFRFGFWILVKIESKEYLYIKNIYKKHYLQTYSFYIPILTFTIFTEKSAKESKKKEFLSTLHL